MEEVLDVYTAEHSEEEPLIAMDEAALELIADVYEPRPMKLGSDAKEDHHYERLGSRALFMFIDPIRGWRRVKHYEHRTRVIAQPGWKRERPGERAI